MVGQRVDAGREQNAAEKIVNDRAGIDLTTQSPNAAQQTTDRFSMSDVAPVSQHAEEFSRDLRRAAAACDVRSTSLLVSAMEIQMEELDPVRSKRFFDATRMFGDAGQTVESAEMLIYALIASRDATYARLHESHLGNQVELALLNNPLGQAEDAVTALVMSIGPNAPAEQVEDLILLAGKLRYINERLKQGATIYEIGSEIFGVTNRNDFLKVAGEHLDEFAMDRLIQFMDNVAAGMLGAQAVYSPIEQQLLMMETYLEALGFPCQSA